MLKRKNFSSILLAVILLMGAMLTAVIVSNPTEPLKVYAESIEDDIDGTSGSDSQSLEKDVDKDDQDVANWIKGQRGMTGEQLANASQQLGPVTKMIGTVVGIIFVLTCAGIFLITALDLLYIAFPPVRNLLYKAGTDGTGAYTGGMGGGGFGRGMMGMGMGGQGGPANGTAKPTQWISDEAVACAAMLGGSAQSQGGGMGMGMGMGMMQPQQEMPMKSVIGTYFKKRAFFMVIFVVAALVLTSSILMGFGVNLAEWVFTLYNKFIA